MYATKLCSCLDAMALFGHFGQVMGVANVLHYAFPFIPKVRLIQVIPGRCGSWMCEFLDVWLENSILYRYWKTLCCLYLCGSQAACFFWLPLIDVQLMNCRCFGRVMSLANSWITRGPVSNINKDHIHWLGLQWRLDHPTTLDTLKPIISFTPTTERWIPPAKLSFPRETQNPIEQQPVRTLLIKTSLR